MIACIFVSGDLQHSVANCIVELVVNSFAVNVL